MRETTGLFLGRFVIRLHAWHRCMFFAFPESITTRSLPYFFATRTIASANEAGVAMSIAAPRVFCHLAYGKSGICTDAPKRTIVRAKVFLCVFFVSLMTRLCSRRCKESRLYSSDRLR